MSTAKGENTLRRGVGYGVFQPLIDPHRIRFSRSVGAASGTDHFIRAEASAARRAGPESALAAGFNSNRSWFACTAVYGVRSASSVKLLRMSLAIKSKIDMVGNPRISSIDFSMLWCE